MYELLLIGTVDVRSLGAGHLTLELRDLLGELRLEGLRRAGEPAAGRLHGVSVLHLETTYLALDLGGLSGVLGLKRLRQHRVQTAAGGPAPREPFHRTRLRSTEDQDQTEVSRGPGLD
ncbi:hypothetical protein EYF80_019873 [Liparis tanakae]|uniref:Uncharacterized protein n=1 Tax=Liparis tanakae TaxID=230148 RepID=A0A4Z2HWM5_9TELE|nr:hypothetical protein EYF80_019873 [Liparis tanakae]